MIAVAWSRVFDRTFCEVGLFTWSLFLRTSVVSESYWYQVRYALRHASTTSLALTSLGTEEINCNSGHFGSMCLQEVDLRISASEPIRERKATATQFGTLGGPLDVGACVSRFMKCRRLTRSSFRLLDHKEWAHYCSKAPQSCRQVNSFYEVFTQADWTAFLSKKKNERLPQGREKENKLYT